MKKTVFQLLLAFGLPVAVCAQPAADTLRIAGTRFTYPLFEAWAKAYTATHPQVVILVGTPPQGVQVDARIASYHLRAGEVQSHEQVALVGRFAELPFVHHKHAQLAQLQQYGLNKAKVQQLFFPAAASTTSLTAQQSFVPIATVYKRSKAACSSVAFAQHYGNQHADIQGQGVPGDDHDLANAVKKDPQAIAFNALNVLFNTQTRKPVEGIAIVPLDVNDNGQTDADETWHSHLDSVLQYINTHPTQTAVPVAPVQLIYTAASKQTRLLQAWIDWMVQQGQGLVAKAGFLAVQER